MNIIDRQTIIISVNLYTCTGLVASQVALPLNLRFAANEVVVKNISYVGAIPPNAAVADIQDIVNIWCDRTNDGLIGSFPNSSNNGTEGNSISCQHNEHFSLSNTFQTGNFGLQFQQSGAGGRFSTFASSDPQPLISQLATQTTFGVVSITLEFLKTK